MALHWDLTKIANHDEVCWFTADRDVPEHDIKQGETLMNPKTNSLIWATMGVGIGEITEKTAPEFYARMQILNLLDKYEGQITAEDIHKHIGLKCNVTYESKASWLKRVTAREFDALLRRYEIDTAPPA